MYSKKILLVGSLCQFVCVLPMFYVRTYNKKRPSQFLENQFFTNYQTYPLNSSHSPLHTAQEMKFSIKDFFSKCDQICWKLQIWSHLLRKSLMEIFIFCALIPLAVKEACPVASIVIPFKVGFRHSNNIS